MADDDLLECMFSCHACGAKKITFRVRHRRPDEDIVAWLEGVIKPAMGAAHSNYNALCRSEHADLQIPINEGAKGIGMRTLN